MTKAERESKRLFRGLTLEKMEWAYGRYLVDIEGSHILEIMEKFEGYKVRRFAQLSKRINPKTLSEWTGYTDQRGIKIFEGDLLEVEGEQVGIGMEWPAMSYEEGSVDRFITKEFLSKHSLITGNMYESRESYERNQNRQSVQTLQREKLQGFMHGNSHRNWGIFGNL